MGRTQVERVVPGVRRIRTLEERVTREDVEAIHLDGQPVYRSVARSELADRFEIEFDGGRSVPAELLSEGTLLAVGLLTRIHQPDRPRVLLLDDLDRGLHIEAQAQLVQLLRDIAATEPLQIVCSTHSPYLLDRFQPEEVRVLALDAERATVLAPLDAHPEFARWQYGTQTGELWAALGEAWLRDRRSAAQDQPLV